MRMCPFFLSLTGTWCRESKEYRLTIPSDLPHSYLQEPPSHVALGTAPLTHFNRSFAHLETEILCVVSPHTSHVVINRMGSTEAGDMVTCASLHFLLVLYKTVRSPGGVKERLKNLPSFVQQGLGAPIIFFFHQKTFKICSAVQNSL